MLSHFLNIILLGPALVIFLVFKDRGQQVAFESKEPLNWAIYVAGAVIVLNIIFCIKGGLTVKEDGSYRYPMDYWWIKWPPSVPQDLEFQDFTQPLPWCPLRLCTFETPGNGSVR